MHFLIILISVDMTTYYEMRGTHVAKDLNLQKQDF